MDITENWPIVHGVDISHRYMLTTESAQYWIYCLTSFPDLYGAMNCYPVNSAANVDDHEKAT